jgi:hypothetical protein
MSWCDPCAANPLTADELSKLGVFWAGADKNAPVDAYVTRLHVRYDREHFAEDLFFQETGDISTFQGRYPMNHPYTGPSSCPASAMENYRKSVETRRQKEAQNLAMLTGWKTEEIWKQMGGKGNPPPSPKKWYQKIFK